MYNYNRTLSVRHLLKDRQRITTSIVKQIINARYKFRLDIAYNSIPYNMWG